MLNSLKTDTVPKSKRVEVAEICADLGISRSLAYAEIRAGRIPSITLGGRRRVIPRAAYERWLEGSYERWLEASSGAKAAEGVCA